MTSAPLTASTVLLLAIATDATPWQSLPPLWSRFSWSWFLGVKIGELVRSWGPWGPLTLSDA